MTTEDPSTVHNSDPNNEYSEETKRILYRHYANLTNNDHSTRTQKWIGLRSLGFSDEECRKMCEPEPIDDEEVKERVKDLNIAHQRELRKLGLQPHFDKSNKPKKPNKDDDIPVLK